MRFVAYGDRKQVAAALKPIYQASSAEAALDALDAFADSVPGRKISLGGQIVPRRLGAVHPVPGVPTRAAQGHSTTNSIEVAELPAAQGVENRGTSPTTPPR